MKQIIIIFLIYTGLLFSSCNSNKKSASFGKKNSSRIGAPGTHKTSADTDKPNVKPLAETNDATRPNNSAMGPGTGGSYASYHYHILKKKVNNKTIDQKNQTYRNTQTDTLSIKADSIDYADNSW